jgi:hypothetical protein
MAAREAQTPAEPTPLPATEGLIDDVLREMPGSFLCPLSKEVMTDPVLLVASGHTYDLPALARHFAMQVRHDAREQRCRVLPTIVVV